MLLLISVLFINKEENHLESVKEWEPPGPALTPFLLTLDTCELTVLK